jgi:heparinase II/III-like protein
MVPLTLPDGRGGWWHDYVCPAHGVALDAVGLTSGKFPSAGAPCRYGCRIDTERVRDAWTVLAHQECARRIVALAGAGDTDVATRLLAEYAVRYASVPTEHEGAAGWMLRGRLFQQALTEAIWAVRLGTAARALPTVPPEVRALLDSLACQAATARRELVDQGRFTSNYTAWLNAAGALCSGDPGWLDGPHGTHQHVLAATGADGWEWEASTYYHSFVLRAYLLALRGRPDAEIPEPVLTRLREMVAALAAVRTPGGTLPALHDGPYAGVGVEDEYAELWALVAERGWPVPVPTEPVTVFGRAGYAVLRARGLHAIVDFGPHGGAHGHRDKLALYLYGTTSNWQPDPGQVPYGHPYWRAHYAATAAHPTFQVDGAEQAECAGSLVEADDTSVTVAVDTAYDGVRARRRLAVRDGVLSDTLTVASDTPRRISLLLRPDVPLSVRTDGETTHSVWAGAELLVGRHTCDQPAAMVCRPAPGPADDPQRTTTHVDWTVADTTDVTFTSTFRAEEL